VRIFLNSFNFPGIALLAGNCAAESLESARAIAPATDHHLQSVRSQAQRNALRVQDAHRDVDLRFSKSGDPAVEKNYRIHYVSPALSGRKQERLTQN